jgi:hypothetical protein
MGGKVMETNNKALSVKQGSSVTTPTNYGALVSSLPEYIAASYQMAAKSVILVQAMSTLKQQGAIEGRFFHTGTGKNLHKTVRFVPLMITHDRRLYDNGQICCQSSVTTGWMGSPQSAIHFKQLASNPNYQHPCNSTTSLCKYNLELHKHLKLDIEPTQSCWCKFRFLVLAFLYPFDDSSSPVVFRFYGSNKRTGQELQFHFESSLARGEPPYRKIFRLREPVKWQRPGLADIWVTGLLEDDSISNSELKKLHQFVQILNEQREEIQHDIQAEGDVDADADDTRNSTAV